MILEYKRHVFGPNETINGALYKHNRHNMDKKILQELLLEFYKRNGVNAPKVGQSCEIPIYEFKS
jgi:hypothetical protein